jgi:magnesium transporter
VVDPAEEEAHEIRKAFGIDDAAFSKAGDSKSKAGLEQHSNYLRVTAVAVSDTEQDPGRERIVLDCFVGENWVLTVHGAEIAVLDDFRDLASGEGEIGILDAPTFLATLLEWVVTSYLRAFDEIEANLEELDVDALKGPSRDPEQPIAALIATRTRVGRLRRALAPHRELFAALSHSEFDPTHPKDRPNDSPS